jgi:mycothiol system anti-sigma-R factor
MEQPAPDCREVLAKLYQYVDHEIVGGDCAAIERHFAECEDCLHHAEFETAFKQIIGRKCTEKVIPPGLLERLRARMREGSA